MKKTVFVNISYYVEIDESESGLSQKIQNKLRENRSLESDEGHVFLKWHQSSFRVLNPRIMNCGRCANCGCWTTNRENNDAIFGLDNVAIHNNKLLCDECLPPDHKWAF